MNSSKNERDMITVTTGPFHLPLEIDSESEMGRDNDRLIITLINPTNTKLEASVKLGVYMQPETNTSIENHLHIFANIPETDINFGIQILEPHTCTRIERNIPGAIGNSSDETNAIYRVTASGDFQVSKSTGEPISGLLEISVVGGSIFNPVELGLEQADPAMYFRYKDFVLSKSYQNIT